MSKRLCEQLEARHLLCDTHAAAFARTPTAANFAAVAVRVSKAAGVDVDSIALPAAPSAELSWTTRAAMPQKREEGASAVLGGKLYVFGGFYDWTFTGTGRTDAYDPSTNTWTQRATIPLALTHAPATVINGEAWLFGGYVGKDPGPPTNRVYIYNPTSNTWRRGPDMPAARGAGAVALVGNTVYYVGGRNADRSADVAATWALNVSSNTWSIKANLPNPRNHIAAATVDGSVYAIGGQWNEASSAINQDDVHRYDPPSNTWSVVASLPQAMSHSFASTFAYNGQIFVAGGEISHNVSTAKVLKFSPRSNEWTQVGLLPAARRAGEAGIINGKIYFAGGSIVGSQKTDVWMSSLLDSVLTSPVSAFD
jgi:N-acetylneuraminic acid mutarotase